MQSTTHVLPTVKDTKLILDGGMQNPQDSETKTQVTPSAATSHDAIQVATTVPTLEVRRKLNIDLVISFKQHEGGRRGRKRYDNDDFWQSTVRILC